MVPSAHIPGHLQGQPQLDLCHRALSHGPSSTSQQPDGRISSWIIKFYVFLFLWFSCWGFWLCDVGLMTSLLQQFSSKTYIGNCMPDTFKGSRDVKVKSIQTFFLSLSSLWSGMGDSLVIKLGSFKCSSGNIYKVQRYERGGGSYLLKSFYKECGSPTAFRG